MLLQLKILNAAISVFNIRLKSVAFSQGCRLLFFSSHSWFRVHVDFRKNEILSKLGLANSHRSALQGKGSITINDKVGISSNSSV